MKRCFVLFLSLLLIGCKAAPAPDVFAAPSPSPVLFCVVLDCGHGGFDGGAVGTATFSALFAGKKNQTVLQVAGTKQSLEWDNESVNDLLIGRRSEPNALLTKCAELVDPATASVISYPAGHAEGFPDAFKQNFTAIYDAMRGKTPANPFATFEDGLHIMKICDALYESARTGRWVSV